MNILPRTPNDAATSQSDHQRSQGVRQKRGGQTTEATTNPDDALEIAGGPTKTRGSDKATDATTGPDEAL